MFHLCWLVLCLFVCLSNNEIIKSFVYQFHEIGKIWIWSTDESIDIRTDLHLNPESVL